MDSSLKQWRSQEKQQEHESEVEQNQTHPPAKIPKLFLTHPLVSHSDINSLPPLPSSTTEATDSLVGLSLFPDDSISPTFHSSRMMMGGGGGGNWYFSMSQLQELELQALIYKYFLAGSSVPPQLLNPIKRSILLQSHPYFIQQHFSPYHSSPLLQTGYWGKGAMDPEPGRCRRTDGKKWRCSRDVVPGHKYCERHVHRGRNRSRKPVESPTTTTASPTLIGAGRDGATTTTAGSGGGSAFNSNTVTIAAAAAPAVASVNRFSLSGQSPSTDFLQLNPSSSTDTSRGLCGPQSGVVENRCGGRVLRPFFDDWPRSSLQEGGNCDAGTNEATDVSLKLSTGDAEDYGQRVNDRVDLQSTQQFNWGSGWATTHVTSMGGPLAEALRSSTTTSNCSPTSVLHQLQPPRGSVSEISYVST